MASMSIMLTLFIHKISSKHDRDYNIQAEFKLKCFSHSLHASLLRRCEVQVLDTDTQLMNFIRKYFLLFILD